MKIKYLLPFLLCSCASLSMSKQEERDFIDINYLKWYDEAKECLEKNKHKIYVNYFRINLRIVPDNSLGKYAAMWYMKNKDTTYIIVERQFRFNKYVIKHELIHDLTETTHDRHGKPFEDCADNENISR